VLAARVLLRVVLGAEGLRELNAQPAHTQRRQVSAATAADACAWAFIQKYDLVLLTHIYRIVSKKTNGRRKSCTPVRLRAALATETREGHR
jgi:hypothetical protein